jgi:tRNA1(Val) A37 N6-methylase TrmN6
VVLGDRGGMCIITAWTEINSISDALQSDRWSRDEIKIIQEFEDQKDERDEYQIEL